MIMRLPLAVKPPYFFFRVLSHPIIHVMDLEVADRVSVHVHLIGDRREAKVKPG